MQSEVLSCVKIATLIMVEGLHYCLSLINLRVECQQNKVQYPFEFWVIRKDHVGTIFQGVAIYQAKQKGYFRKTKSRR